MKSKVYIIHLQIPLGQQGLLKSFKMILKFKNILKNWMHNLKNKFIFNKANSRCYRQTVKKSAIQPGKNG